MYGISPSDDPSHSSRVEHDKSKFRLSFSKILAEDKSVSVCKAYRVGAMGTDDDSRPRPLKVTLKCELDIEVLLRHKKKIGIFCALCLYSPKLFSLPERLRKGAEGRNSGQAQSGRGESCHTGRQDYIMPHDTEIISMAGASWAIRLPKHIAYKKLLALQCLLSRPQNK